MLFHTLAEKLYYQKKKGSFLGHQILTELKKKFSWTTNIKLSMK